MKTEVMHWCSKCRMSTINEQESETCPDGHDMASIGWISTASQEGDGSTVPLPINNERKTND